MQRSHAMPFTRVCLALLRTSLTIALLTGLALASGSARADEPISIKLATLAPEGTAWMKIVRASMQEIEQKLNGRVKVTIYGGGVQGDEKVAVQKMKTGQLQGAAVTILGLSEIVPELTALNLPLVFSNQGQVAATRDAMYQHFSDKLWESGFKVVSWGDAGFFYLYSAQPIRSPEDLKKGKVWVWNSDPVFNELVLAAGAAPIPLGIQDVLSALNTGQVDTVLVAPIGLVSLQWYTKMKYQLSEPLTFVIGALLIDRKVWEQLTPEEQEVFDTVYAKWQRVMAKKGEKDVLRAHELLATQGIEIIEPSAEDMTAWLDVSQQTWKRLTNRAYSEELLAEMLRHRDAYKPDDDSTPASQP